MNPKTSISLSIVAIAAVVLLFASGPLIGNHQALAYRHYHGGHHGGYGHYGGHYRGHYGGHYRGHYGGYGGHYRGHYRR